MISLDRLGCRAYGAQALKRRSVKIHRSQPTCRQHQRTEVQPEVHRNALDSKVLQKTPVLAMAQAQTCHRSRKCTKVASEPNAGSGSRRARSSSIPARPYICRFSILSRLSCPSTGPLLHGSLTAASTALRSCFKVRTKRTSEWIPVLRACSIQRCRVVTLPPRRIARKPKTSLRMTAKPGHCRLRGLTICACRLVTRRAPWLTAPPPPAATAALIPSRLLPQVAARRGMRRLPFGALLFAGAPAKGILLAPGSNRPSPPSTSPLPPFP